MLIVFNFARFLISLVFLILAWTAKAALPDQTGPKGQSNKIKLARRASTIGPDWPSGQGPESQNRTGPKGQYSTASTTGPNWPEGPVSQDKTGPFGPVLLARLKNLNRHSNYSSVEIETQIPNQKF